MQQGLLLQPQDDNARFYLERAAELEPTSLEVLEMRLRLAEVLTVSARLLLDSDVLEGAEELMSAAFELGAEDESLAVLSEDLAVAYAMREQRELDAMHSEALARIANGRLVEPEEASAHMLIQEIRERAPSFLGLRELVESFGAEAVARARVAIAEQDWRTAASLVSVLEQIDFEVRTRETLAAELGVARQQAEFLASASPVSVVRAVTIVEPAYPRGALASGESGWVDLEFIVDLAGRPRNVAVVDAEPVGEFEDSAVAAVRQYEFEPFVLDGQRYERRIRLRIRYTFD